MKGGGGRGGGGRRAHVVGAGLAGLAAALDLSDAGWAVTLHEASPKAGGRCRSYHDDRLGRRIDNGNHLILSGNRAVLAHARRVGAAHRLETQPEAAFPFADLATGARWTVRLPRSPLGALAARPPGAGRAEAVAGVLGLLSAGRGWTVAEAVRGRGAMWRAFWEPMTTAVLNAPPESASAALLRAALLRSFLRGAAACRPVLAPDGLGAALIEPSMAVLRAQGADLRMRSRGAGLEVGGGRATALGLADGTHVALGPRDAVVLAVPPPALAALLPGTPVPGPGAAILNAHFRVPAAAADAAPPVMGLLGGSAQWLFRRGDVLSVTVSAAETSSAWTLPKEGALDLLWGEVARALGLGDLAPAARRLLRERGATCDQSPAGAALRPRARTALANVAVAGDFARTGLPATLEGAVLSGRAAAAALA